MLPCWNVATGFDSLLWILCTDVISLAQVQSQTDQAVTIEPHTNQEVARLPIREEQQTLDDNSPWQSASDQEASSEQTSSGQTSTVQDGDVWAEKEPTPEITREQIQQLAALEAANWQSARSNSLFEQIKTGLAVIGVMALAVLVLRVAPGSALAAAGVRPVQRPQRLPHRVVIRVGRFSRDAPWLALALMRPEHPNRGTPHAIGLEFDPERERGRYATGV